MAVIFSRGKPYRRAIYTNGAFMFSILLLTIVCVYITVYPADWVLRWLQMILSPYEGRFAILALALINFLICFFIENVIIERVIENILKKKLYKPEKSKKRYLRIEYELKNYENWPKFNEQSSILSIEKEDNTDVVNATRNNSYSTKVSTEQETNDFNILIKQSSKNLEKTNGFENKSFVND